MDLGPGAGRLRPFASEHWADLLEADSGGDKRPGSTTPLAYAAMVAPRPGEADKMPTAVTSLRTKVRVSMWLWLPAKPI